MDKKKSTVILNFYCLKKERKKERVKENRNDSEVVCHFATCFNKKKKQNFDKTTFDCCKSISFYLELLMFLILPVDMRHILCSHCSM